LGDEDDGNVAVNFGYAGSDKKGNANLGRTLGNTITINYDAVDSQAKSFGLNTSERAVLDVSG